MLPLITPSRYGIKSRPEVEWAFVAQPAATPPVHLKLKAWPAETELDEDKMRKPMPLADLQARPPAAPTRRAH